VGFLFSFSFDSAIRDSGPTLWLYGVNLKSRFTGVQAFLITCQLSGSVLIL